MSFEPKLPLTFEVIYIDDEDQNTYLFKDQLENDFNISCFNYPDEAIDYCLKNDRALVVITDYAMPAKNGMQVAETIKEKKSYLNFIMVTANPENDKSLLHKSLRKKLFYEFFQKPIDFVGNSNVIREAIKSAATDALANYAAFEYDRAAIAFCNNPITNFERQDIERILSSRFTMSFNWSFTFDSVSLKEPNGNVKAVIQKTNTGGWELFYAENEKQEKILGSRKFVNIFNAILNDKDLATRLKVNF